MVQINASDMKNLASSNLIDTGMTNSFGTQAADNGMMFTCTLKGLVDIFAKLNTQFCQCFAGIQPIILQIIVLFLEAVRRPETEFCVRKACARAFKPSAPLPLESPAPGPKAP